MMTLSDGRSELWQWDTGRTLSVPDDCSQVHFSNKVFGRSIDVDVVEGVAIIPDILLQTDKELTAWAFVGTVENGYTKISKVFKVNKRNKPADYVFTPQDQSTLGEILDRIEDLENRPSGDVSEEDIQNAVNDYLEKNPVSIDEKDPTVPDWAKQPEKPKYTAAEVGALPADMVIPDGGIPIPPTASVGQTIVVKAVDENGKPTKWEAADLTTEKKTKIITIVDITAEEEITISSDDTDTLSFGDAVIQHRHFFYKTPEGEQLKAKKIFGYIYSPSSVTLPATMCISAYYDDGDPAGWNFGDYLGANQGFLVFISSSCTIAANGYYTFIGTADCKFVAGGAVGNLVWPKVPQLQVAYESHEEIFPYISGVKIYSTANIVLPVGAKFILKAEVEDNG